MKNFLVTYTMSVLVTVFLLAGSAAWAKQGPVHSHIKAIKADMELVRDVAKEVRQWQDSQALTPAMSKDDLVSLMREKADAMDEHLATAEAQGRKLRGRKAADFYVSVDASRKVVDNFKQIASLYDADFIDVQQTGLMLDINKNALDPFSAPSSVILHGVER